jgi:Uma2 family endonuclease
MSLNLTGLVPPIALRPAARLTDEELMRFSEENPDFIIEIRSQSDSRTSVETKMQLWLENGAELAWLVDPIDVNVTIYRTDHASELLERPEVVKATEPVAGFELPCARLWPSQ